VSRKGLVVLSVYSVLALIPPRDSSTSNDPIMTVIWEKYCVALICDALAVLTSLLALAVASMLLFLP
jgi:hypothetical protein